MAIVFKIDPNMEKVMAMLDKIDKKVSSTYDKMTKEANKATKQLKISNEQLMMAGASTLAFFWGVAQVSPVVNSMIGEMSSALGVIFDVIFTSLLPVFYPLMEVLWKFAEWLQGQPEWLKMLIGFLILIPPVLIVMYSAYKAYMTIKGALAIIEALHTKLMMGQIGATWLDIKSKIAQTAATIKTTVAVRGLNMAIMSGPLMILAIVVGGIAAAAWYMNSQFQDVNETATDPALGMLSKELMNLQSKIDETTINLGDLQTADSLLVGSLQTNTTDFISAVNGVLSTTAGIPQSDVKRITDLMKDLGTLPAGSELAIPKMQEIVNILGANGVNGTVIGGIDNLIGEHSNLISSYGFVQSAIEATKKKLSELAIQYETQSYLENIATGGFNLETILADWSKFKALAATGNAFAQSKVDLIESLIKEGDAGQRMLYRYMQYNDQSFLALLRASGLYAPGSGAGGGGTPSSGGMVGDFMQRPGQPATFFSPQDTVVGVKDTSLLGGGGGTSVTINVENNTFRDKSDIDYMVAEVSKRLQHEIDRSV